MAKYIHFVIYVLKEGCDLKNDFASLWVNVPGENGKTTKEHVSQSSMAYKKTTYKSKFNLCLKHMQ